MEDLNLKGQIIFMTGATSGLGKVAACHIANKGAKVIVTVRNKEKGENLINQYKATYPKGAGQIELVKCNLNSFESITKACDEVKTKTDRLDMIINNAGIMNFKFQESKDGIEETLHVNLLAPMLILHYLGGLLEGSKNAKIINTASGLHQGVINFDDIELRKNKFTSFKVYRQSKLGVILLGRLLSKKLSEKGIGIYSQHPGVVKTALGRDAGWLSRLIFWLMGKSPEKGAQTLLHLVATPAESLTSGEYYADNKVTEITEESNDMEMAAKLLGVTREYLSAHLNGSSLIFE
jgi:NAD(P)-dependent dehydrogenase (short-subunit alcohol dehydrogenase family)